MADSETHSFSGGCMFQTGLMCGIHKNCETCGFNPDNGVRERRIAKAMEEYRRKLELGLAYPL